jgi:hypothetical protein
VSSDTIPEVPVMGAGYEQPILPSENVPEALENGSDDASPATIRTGG